MIRLLRLSKSRAKYNVQQKEFWNKNYLTESRIAPRVSCQRGERDADANVSDVELQEQRPHVLSAQLARDLGQRNFLQNLFCRDQNFFVQTQPLFGPVFPGVFVAQPEEDGSIDGHGLEEDEGSVEGDVDHVLLGWTGLALEGVAQLNAETIGNIQITNCKFLKQKLNI